MSLAMWDHPGLPATRHKWTHPALIPGKGWYSIYLPLWDGRLSWPRWLVTYRDDLPARRRSPIKVVTQQCMTGSWTRNLLITSPTPWPLHHQLATKTCSMRVGWVECCGCVCNVTSSVTTTSVQSSYCRMDGHSSWVVKPALSLSGISPPSVLLYQCTFHRTVSVTPKVIAFFI